MRVWLALGSNLGDRSGALTAVAVALEAEGYTVSASSPIYETDPVGGPARQPAYLNQVIEIRTDEPIRALFDACMRLERALGRDRSKEVPSGPRPIDIDLIASDGPEINEPDLVVPHPRAAGRAFVLVPLCDIAPDAPLGAAGTAGKALASLGEIRGVRPA